MVKAITAKEAKHICERQGLGFDDGQRTHWAYDEDIDGVYDFDSKRERDEFVSEYGKITETQQAVDRALKAIFESYKAEGMPEAEAFAKVYGVDDASWISEEARA